MSISLIQIMSEHQKTCHVAKIDTTQNILHVGVHAYVEQNKEEYVARQTLYNNTFYVK